MSSPFDFDRQITAWLDEQAPMQEPQDLADVALARTRRMRQLPGWATLERWVPMETRYKFGAVSRTALILVILAVMLAVVSAIALGQQPSPKLPPLGVARNGLIAFDADGHIFVVHPDGTGRKQLTTGPQTDVRPMWSQDGMQIAYWSQDTPDGITALDVMDADGGNVRTLVAGLTLSPHANFMAWSYDGQYLAYSDQVAQSAKATVRINVVPTAGGAPVVIASPGQDPTWSPDGKHIAFQAGDIDADGLTLNPVLIVIDSDGKDGRIISEVSGSTGLAFSFPQWTPDGSLIAYQSGFNGSRDVFVASADGREIRTIADLPSEENWPAWSPDGTQLAYDGPSTTAGMFQIVVVDPDGSNPTTLEHPPLACNCRFSWSPDGTKIVAFQDGPTEATGTMLVIDTSAKDALVTIPTGGVPASGHVSWQRLAP